MNTFLHEVADRIWNEQQGQMERTIVVFNNRRAGLFFQKALQSKSSKPFFMPRIMGIDDLVSQMGGLQIADHESLVFELYDIHLGMEHKGREFDTFEEFLAFGEMMINDFSQIDLYCVDAEKIFNNIHELKRLGEWSVDGEKPTPFQERYLQFYRSLYDYYQQLRKLLADKKMAYSGMAYRLLAEQIDDIYTMLDCSHIYFVGFNALSNAEERIISCFVRNGIGSLICDGDDYYFSDSRQEAGDFLRKHADQHKGIGGYPDHFAMADKKIHIVNCPENVMQAKYAGQIAGDLLKNDSRAAQQCAIVLADEGLLLPLLNSLPENVKETNITMGFPFQLTNIYALAEKILSLYGRRNGGRFYHADITAIISDMIVSQLLNLENAHSFINKKLTADKVIYATGNETVELIKELKNCDTIAFLFDEEEPTADGIIDKLYHMAELLTQSDVFEQNTKEREALACLVQILEEIRNMQARRGFIKITDTLQRIFRRMAQRRSVAFYGEPLTGIQILGMLETRSIDFSHLILVSLNEGTLPKGKESDSLIPFALKKAFGLPTYDDKDAVYAYNFYRLLQRCDEAWLLYCSDAEGIGKGEPSRFLMQVKNELAETHSNITIVEEILSAHNNKANGNESIVIKADESARKRLAEKATKGFSPSALNRYRKCPRFFYYNDMLGVTEKEELSEEVEANELGTFIHAILCDIYSRDSDKKIRIATLEEARKEIETLVDNRFKEDILKGRSVEGKNHIYNEVSKLELSSFLDKEIAQLKEGHTIQMLMSEEEMQIPLNISINGTETAVTIEGTADRIDYFDGTLRIVDYKSGSVDPSDLKKSEKDTTPYDVPDKWFQVMTYAWLYCRKHGYNGNFQAGIVPLRSLNAGFASARWENETLLTSQHVDAFEEMLTELLSDIMAPDNSFEMKQSSKNCQYCPFKRLCKNI